MFEMEQFDYFTVYFYKMYLQIIYKSKYIQYYKEDLILNKYQSLIWH